MRTLRFTVFTVAFFSAASCSMASYQSSNIQIQSPKPINFQGRWSPDCDKLSGIKIIDNENILIEVNLNQIYVSSAGVLKGDTLIINLQAPEDLGRGGMMLNWDDFSKKVPIAKMMMITENISKVEWLGFYDESLKARTWTNEADFLTTKSDTFAKCNDH